jgi:hypothetical protein
VPLSIPVNSVPRQADGGDQGGPDYNGDDSWWAPRRHQGAADKIVQDGGHYTPWFNKPPIAPVALCMGARELPGIFDGFVWSEDYLKKL